jgi:hypothetical protein
MAHEPTGTHLNGLLGIPSSVFDCTQLPASRAFCGGPRPRVAEELVPRQQMDARGAEGGGLVARRCAGARRGCDLLKDPLGIYFLGSSRTLGVVSRLA